MIVFGIHFNFFVVLPIQLKTYKFNRFLFFTRQNVSQRLCAIYPDPINIKISKFPLGKIFPITYLPGNVVTNNFAKM